MPQAGPDRCQCRPGGVPDRSGGLVCEHSRPDQNHARCVTAQVIEVVEHSVEGFLIREGTCARQLTKASHHAADPEAIELLRVLWREVTVTGGQTVEAIDINATAKRLCQRGRRKAGRIPLPWERVTGGPLTTAGAEPSVDVAVRRPPFEGTYAASPARRTDAYRRSFSAQLVRKHSRAERATPGCAGVRRRRRCAR